MSLFKHVAQPPGSFACLGCVAAMVTGETLEDVQDFTSHYSLSIPFQFLEVARYFNAHGFNLGGYLAGRWPVLGNLLAVVTRCRLAPAVVVVRKKGGAGTHAVLWTGRVVLDPAVCSAMRLRDYVVLEWWPILKVIDGGDDAKG